MGETITRSGNSKRIGRIMAGVLLILAAAIFSADRFGGLDYRCLLLSEVRNLRGLQAEDRVLYRGVGIGYVEGMRPAGGAELKFSLRLRVKCSAFRQIPLDAVVRIEPQGTNDPYLVNILPGREPPPEDYPGKVKVLKEATAEDLFLRGLRDVLDGMAEVSRAKSTEAELERLRQENERLKRELEQLKKR